MLVSKPSSHIGFKPNEKGESCTVDQPQLAVGNAFDRQCKYNINITLFIVKEIQWKS